MVVELTFVLLLVMSGEKIEYTPYQSLSNACQSEEDKETLVLTRSGRAKK